jgi:hypothetical protein
MNNRLRAGVELSLEKVARASELSHVLRQKIASHDKTADGPFGGLDNISGGVFDEAGKNIQGVFGALDSSRTSQAARGGLVGGGIGLGVGGGGSLAYDAATGQDMDYKRALILSILGGAAGAGIGAAAGA